MAEGEYRRLTCAVNACEGKHKAHGYCLRHYRQWQRGGVKQDATNCAHCGEAFTPSTVGNEYCSKRCKLAAWKAANTARWAELNDRIVSAVYAGYCERCGQAFVSRRQRAHCSERCVRAAWYAAHPAASIAPATRICPICRREFFPSEAAAMQSRLCSPACIDKARRAHQRVHKQKRRAAERGVHAEAVDPIKVFDRDGWRCQLCGIRTPKAKRGTCKPDAPELDHIIPLSKGGEHTYRNTQCACRRCNGAKSDTPKGQLLLIG
jgi:5-methylcytosine-specific restriction endonuclease McrA